MKTYEELEQERAVIKRKLDLHESVLEYLKQDERRIADQRERAEFEIKKLREKKNDIDKEIREKLIPLYPEGFERGESDAS